MALSEGLTVACTDENRRGGIKKLWIAERDLVDSFAPVVGAHEYDNVLMMDGGGSGSPSVTDFFYLYEFEDFTGNMTSEGNAENGSKVLNRTLEFHIPKMTKEHAKALQEVFVSCRVIIVYEDFNDLFFVAGYDELLEKKSALIATVSEMTGTALQDQNGYTLSFAGVGGELLREFTGLTTADPFKQTP